MGRKTRKFIDKKQDVVHRFRVVQRSQKDPLVADETAPQGVLLDTECSDSHKEELLKYGVYFDDEYDYLQHLRGVREAVDWENCDVEVYTIRKEDQKKDETSHKNVGLVLPSSAFESYVEEPIGLLNKAAPVTGPRPELDPDIVAELDSDEDLEEGEIFDPDDCEGFPDNFVSLLNAEGDEDIDIDEDDNDADFSGIEKWLGGTRQSYDDMPPLEGSESMGKYLSTIRESRYEQGSSSNESRSSGCGGDSDFFVSDDEKDEVRSLPKRFAKGHSKSNRSSRTAASSATVPRTELLSQLDERFERLFSEEYAEEQIGALDGEVIEGPFDVNSEVFKRAVQATVKQLERSKISDMETDDRTVNWVKESMRLRNYMDDDKEEIISVEVKEKPMYDCESILSTYSNTENRPQLIDDSDLFKKKKRKLTKKAIRDHNREAGEEDSDSKDIETVTLLSCISAISNRPKDETPEERRERKQALKELRRERRKEKKVNRLAFKEELKQQKKITLSKPRCRMVQVA